MPQKVVDHRNLDRQRRRQQIVEFSQERKTASAASCTPMPIPPTALNFTQRRKVRLVRFN